MPTAHASLPRGITELPHSTLYAGRFGRMFRNLPVCEPDDAAIAALAAQMVETDAVADPGQDAQDSGIPSGYTYLAQFIDHDVTFDPVSSLTHRNDPDALTDFRTPALDLDNVYGRGPDDQPYLYESLTPDGKSPVFVLGEHDGVQDLQRNVNGRAMIGDPRNDENLIIAQLQLLMLTFHNRVMADVVAGGFSDQLHSTAPADRFEEVSRLVRWHYQWVVLHDFLPRVCGRATTAALLPRAELTVGGTKVQRYAPIWFRPKNEPYMPVEFSVAAYRFGHTMVRPSYHLSAASGAVPIFGATNADGLAGFRPLPADRVLEWERFFPVNPAVTPQHARRLDAKLSPPLSTLPPNVATGIVSLGQRNLARAKALGLPGGIAVARAMGQEPLKAAALGLPELGWTDPDVPLFYYLLTEADVLGGGEHLGPVGGRIVAEVLAGLIAYDSTSYVSVDPGWVPAIGGAGESFTMADLVRYTLAT